MTRQRSITQDFTSKRQKVDNEVTNSSSDKGSEVEMEEVDCEL